MKKIIKAFIASIYFGFFIFPFKRGTRRIVLFYHGIGDSERTNFERQMSYLSSNAVVVPPSKIKQYRESDKIIVAVTFDDAFLSLRKNAIPVLKKYDMCAAICAPTDNLGSTPQWNLEEWCQDGSKPVMDKNDLIYILSEGFEVFSHTVSHSRLTDLSDDALSYELSASKEILEQILSQQVIAISYPHGACDGRVAKAAEVAGYSMGFTIEPDFIEASTDNLLIGRTSVSPSDSMFVFRLKLHGAYRVFTLIKRIRRSFAQETFFRQ